MQSHNKESKRKPYDSPKLSIYGNIAEITQNFGTLNPGDNAGMANHKKTT